MKTTTFAVLALGALLFLIPGSGVAEEAAEAQPEAGAQAQAAETAAAPDTVVATVNGAGINKGLLDKVMKQVPAIPGAANMEREVLDKLIDLELVAQAAEKDGLDKDPEFVSGIDMYKKQQLFSIYLNKVIVDTVKVEPEELQKYYDEHSSEFATGEEIRASHILVDTEEKAMDVKRQLDEGASFEEIATAESTCPSASRGGDLGFFKKGSMVPAFEQAAFALNEGEVSGPVKTEFGWHIIKLTAKKEAGVKSFEDAKPEIEQKLLGEKQQKAYDELLEKLRHEAKITVNVDALGDGGQN